MINYKKKGQERKNNIRKLFSVFNMNRLVLNGNSRRIKMILQNVRLILFLLTISFHFFFLTSNSVILIMSTIHVRERIFLDAISEKKLIHICSVAKDNRFIWTICLKRLEIFKILHSDFWVVTVKYDNDGNCILQLTPR